MAAKVFLDVESVVVVLVVMASQDLLVATVVGALAVMVLEKFLAEGVVMVFLDLMVTGEPFLVVSVGIALMAFL